MDYDNSDDSRQQRFGGDDGYSNPPMDQGMGMGGDSYQQDSGMGGGYQQDSGMGGGYQQDSGMGGGYQQDSGMGGGYQQDSGMGGQDGGMSSFDQQQVDDTQIADDQRKESRARKEEDIAGVGGLAAGGFALYEKHEEKKDPEHAGRHKLEAELAGAGGIGAEGVALYERHEKKEDESDVQALQSEEDGGEKKHHWF